LGSVAGAGFQIAGEKAQADEANQVAQFNQRMANREAALIRQRGGIEASRLEAAGRDESAAIQAQVAGSGLAGGSLGNLYAIPLANTAADAALLRQQAEEQAQAREFEGILAARSGQAAVQQAHYRIGGIAAQTSMSAVSDIARAGAAS
jgi:hypothetical protein